MRTFIKQIKDKFEDVEILFSDDENDNSVKYIMQAILPNVFHQMKQFVNTYFNKFNIKTINVLSFGEIEVGRNDKKIKIELEIRQD